MEQGRQQTTKDPDITSSAPLLESRWPLPTKFEAEFSARSRLVAAACDWWHKVTRSFTTYGTIFFCSCSPKITGRGGSGGWKKRFPASLIPALEPKVIQSLAYFSFRACLPTFACKSPTSSINYLFPPRFLPRSSTYPPSIHSRHSSLPVINHNLNFISNHHRNKLESHLSWLVPSKPPVSDHSYHFTLSSPLVTVSLS